jgi:sRNA-binding regulator protein Hfq
MAIIPENIIYNMKKIVFIICMVLCNTLLAFAQNNQEIVYLKNGNKVKGIIIEEIPNTSIKVKTSNGSILVYSIHEIEKIISPEDEIFQKKFRFKQYNNNPTYDKTGYKGFIDFGGVIGIGNRGDGAIAVSTTHGYQFNPYFFFGAGIGIEYHMNWETFFIPVFADIKTYFLNKNISPFLGLKAGYSVYDGKGCYINPHIGVTLSSSPRFGMNLTIGYNMQKAKINDRPKNIKNYKDNMAINGISIKLGFEF